MGGQTPECFSNKIHPVYFKNKRRPDVPKKTDKPFDGFPAVKITLQLSGDNNRKVQTLRIVRGGKETKAELTEKLLNEYLNTLP